MTVINPTNFRKDLFNHLENVVRYNAPIHVPTKNGSVVIISDEDYRGMMETLYIESVPGLKQSILQSIEDSKDPKNCIALEDRTLDEFIDYIKTLPED